MSLTVRQFCETEAAQWDGFCRNSLQGTFLHTRRFISYHRDRFEDLSLVILEGDEWYGIIPAARVGPSETVVSHPGLTYGGIHHTGRLFGSRMIEAFEVVKSHYASMGLQSLRYKAVPIIYHCVAAQDDLYALARLGARRIRCDLSSTVDLACRRQVTARRRRSYRKAVSAGLVLVSGRERLSEFWPLLEANLQLRHQARPVHNIEEIVDLADRFPVEISFLGALADERLIAGIVQFVTSTTAHAQYIAASEEGFRLAALDLVFEEAIASAQRDGRRWFDFGISNEMDGLILNDGLYTFKTEFGGGGTICETYELDLKQ